MACMALQLQMCQVFRRLHTHATINNQGGVRCQSPLDTKRYGAKLWSLNSKPLQLVPKNHAQFDLKMNTPAKKEADSGDVRVARCMLSQVGQSNARRSRQYSHHPSGRALLRTVCCRFYLMLLCRLQICLQGWLRMVAKKGDVAWADVSCIELPTSDIRLPCPSLCTW